MRLRKKWVWISIVEKGSRICRTKLSLESKKAGIESYMMPVVSAAFSPLKKDLYTKHSKLLTIWKPEITLILI
jgi:hypothetical protein